MASIVLLRLERRFHTVLCVLGDPCSVFYKMDCTVTITQTEYKLDFAPTVIFQPPHFDLKSKNNYESKTDRNEER